jgi:hypothetical protein
MVNNETDAQYIVRIKSMTALQLLEEIVREPTYLTDPYYSWFGEAMRERVAVLKDQAEVLRRAHERALVDYVNARCPPKMFGVHELPAEMVPQLHASGCAHDIEAAARLDDADARRPPSVPTLRRKLGIR